MTTVRKDYCIELLPTCGKQITERAICGLGSPELIHVFNIGEEDNFPLNGYWVGSSCIVSVYAW